MQFSRAFTQLVRWARISVLLAAADYASVWTHGAVRSRGVQTIILPTQGRPTANLPSGRWCWAMK
jgi:hypothetical protein